MNPMRSFWATFAAVAALLNVHAPGLAQEPDVEAGTNDVVSAEVLAQLSEMMQAAQSAQAEDGTPSDATNGVSPADLGTMEMRGEGAADGRADGSNRFQSFNRAPTEDGRTKNRRSSRSRPRSGSPDSSSSARSSERNPGTAVATNGGPATLDYSSFKLIVERNIFDPNRYPRRAGTAPVRPPATRVDSLTLVGTMAYDKGTFAFFDGTSSDYQKALKLTDKIAGYQVDDIVPDAVTLTAGTNRVHLRVGTQLRREENGPWTVSGQAMSYSAPPSSPSTNAAAGPAASGTDTASTAEQSEIIKRLMQRRSQE